MLKDLLCCEFKNDIQAQEAFNQITVDPHTRILEFGEKNAGQIVLLAEISKNFSSFDNSSIIKNPHKDLMLMYFKTLNTKVVRNLCILEAQSLLELLKTVNFLLGHHSFQGLEIYRGDNSSKKSYALLCNGDKEFHLPEDNPVSIKIIEYLNTFVAQEFF